jgi:hypothetical protein
MPTGLSALSSPEDLTAEMHSAGCTEVVVHSVEGSWGGESVDHVREEIAQLLDWMPLLTGIDAEGRARFDEAIRAAIEIQTTAPEAVRIPVTANIAIGSKPQQL